MHSAHTTWLIIEPDLSGHHFVYLHEIVRGALARKIRVVLGVGDDSNGEEISARIKAAFPSQPISVVRVRAPPIWAPSGGMFGLAWNMLRWRQFLSQAFQAARQTSGIDFIFVPYLDRALHALSVLGSPFAGTPFSGITMSQRFHLKEMGVKAAVAKAGRIRKRLFLSLLRAGGLRRVHVIDDTLQAYVRQNYPELADKVCYIPDPSEPATIHPQDQARLVLGLPRNAVIVLVYGYIDARKGIARLLKWIASAGVDQSVHVLLAGRIANDVEAILRADPGAILLAEGRLWVLDRYVEQAEESLVFSAADIVWIGYERVESMSGVLVKAALFRRAVLFENYGLIGRYAKTFGSTQASASTPTIDISHLPEGIELRFFGEDAATAPSIPDHSWENACRAIFDLPSP